MVAHDILYPHGREQSQYISSILTQATLVMPLAYLHNAANLPYGKNEHRTSESQSVVQLEPDADTELHKSGTAA